MKVLLGWTLAAVATLSGISRAQSAEKKDANAGSSKDGSARKKLIGAWRLGWMEEPGPESPIERGCCRTRAMATRRYSLCFRSQTPPYPMTTLKTAMRRRSAGTT